LNNSSNNFIYLRNKLKEEKDFNKHRFSRKKPFVNRLWHNVRKKKTFGIFLSLPVRRVLSLLLSLFLILIAIASASIISLPVASNPEILHATVVPQSVYNGDSLIINVSVENSYNICFVTADFAGIESIDLLLVDNSSSKQLWQGIWSVRDMNIGEHIVTISALDAENITFQANVKWYVLSQNNETNENKDNNIDGSFDVENDTSNTNTSLIIEKNSTLNQTVISSGLNVSLYSSKETYNVNESVLIFGAVKYNNSLVNTSVNLLITSSFYNSSIMLNATNGEFHYQIKSLNLGTYFVEVKVNYENQTTSNITTFQVQNKSSDNISLLSADLYIWDDTDFDARYSDDVITFYANYSSFDKSIENATCYISFDFGSRTEPILMEYSNSYYVYNRSFNVIGTYEFNVWCSYPGYENKSDSSQFFIHGNESTVSIVDPKEEHIDIIPGTSFYVERTIDGVNGTEIIFASLFSDALTLKKIEFVNNKYDSKGETQNLRIFENNGILSPSMYSAGRAVSPQEKIIDRHRDKLPSELKQLNMVGHTSSFKLNGPITIRIWFQTPSWEEIDCGCKPSSGRISYLVFADNGGDWFDFESSTWWSSDWGYRKLITVNSSQVDATLTNFPILVYRASDGDLASHAQDDGDDIAFVLYSDNSTQLNHEIELFNGTTGELVAWVNVTTLSSFVDTKIWMYYGNSTCISQENIVGVWDSNYVMIQHLNETSDPHVDSTSYNNDGNESGVVNQSANGKIDGADDFDGLNDYVLVNESSTLEPPNQMTISAWIKLKELGSQQDIIYKRHLSGAPWGSYELMIYTDNLAYFQWVNSSGNWHDVNSSSPLVPGQWYYIVGVKNATHITMYINGSSSGIKSVLANGTLYNSDDHLFIGDQGWGGGYFNGTIDEVTISKIARNSSWINTSYNTMNNTGTFLSFSGEANPCTVPTEGDWNISTYCILANTTEIMVRDKDINVLSGGRLDIINSTLIMNLTDDGNSNIYIHNNGMLFINDSTFNTTNSSNNPKIIAYSGSILEIRNSIFNFWGYDGGNPEGAIDVYTDNVIIDSNNFSNCFQAVYGEDVNNITLNNNRIINYTKDALDFYGINNSEITNNYVSNSGNDDAFNLYNILNSLISSNILNYTVDDGLSIDGAVNLTISNNQYTNISDRVINIDDDQRACLEITLINETISSSPVGVSLGFGNNYFGNVTVIDCNITTTTGSAFESFGTNGNNITIYNSQFNKSRISVGAGWVALIVKWSIDVYVNNSNGQPIEDATVNITDIFSNQVASVSTNNSGWIQQQNITEFTQNNTERIYYTNYTVNVSKSGYNSSLQSINISDRKTLYFTLDVEEINTKVDAITPYKISSSPITINATGPSDLDNVTLWYRYSSDNSSWGTWWNDNWTYCKLITINSSQVENDLSNFPVLIYKSSDSDLAVHAQDNGNDIAFVLYNDNKTQLNHEIEFFNGSTGEIAAWVNITNLSSSNDTKIWMYYGNSICSCQQNKTGVWDSHYIGIWHLNETSGKHFDSTSNGYNSNTVVGVNQDGIGKIDGGDEFDGSDDYIDITMNLPSNVTISAWAQKDTDSYDMLWCIDSDNNGPDLFFGNIGTGLIALNTWDSWDNPFCNVPVDANDWHLYTTIIESSNTKLYIDDQLGGTANYRNPEGTSFHISSSAGYDWDGKIDEVRISDISRSSSWINTSYNTMNNTNTFISFDSERQICTDWNIWPDTNNPDISTPWSWNFNFPNSSGYYEFYSIGKKLGSADEMQPSTADTICRYDNIPTIDVISPGNGSSGVVVQPTCSIWANDSDGDTLMVLGFIGRLIVVCLRILL